MKQNFVRDIFEFDLESYKVLVRVAERLNITKGMALVYVISLALILIDAKADGWRISLQKREERKNIPDM